MPTPIAVVDASVVVKWVLAETGRDAARILLRQFLSHELHLLAPSLLLDEIASVLAKSSRRHILTPEQALQAWTWLKGRRPRILDTPELQTGALAIALRYHISYWDSCYIALAMERRCALITADVRLYHAAVKHYPYVRLLSPPSSN